MPRGRGIPLVVAALLAASAGLAAAGGETTAAECGYAWPVDPDCVVEFPDSGGDSNNPEADVVVGGEWHDVLVVVVDDIWGGGTIAGFVCNDGDDDGTCGETGEGEIAVEFCGSGGQVSSEKDWDGDGHRDFGARLVITVYGPVQSTLACGPAAAPSATSGGVLDPTGGIYLTLIGGSGPAGEAGQSGG